MRNTKFKLTRIPGLPVSDEELLSDLRRIASLNNDNKVSRRSYKELGGIYAAITYQHRFGSWNNALSIAEILPTSERNISDQRLFNNILILWQYYGQQPRQSHLASAPSTISKHPYKRRFGSWRDALEAFVNYANSSDLEFNEENSTQAAQRKTGRDPSLRLRWRVLQRDRFTCRNCGKSPATTLDSVVTRF